MTNLFLFFAVFLRGMMLFVSGASLSTQCKIPSDLNIHYETLTTATIGNKFLIPAEYISSSANQTLYRGETTCPKTLPSNGETKDRSSCPWYTKNSPVWPDRVDSRSWDQNPVDSKAKILPLSHEETSESEGNLNGYESQLLLFTYIR